MRKQQIETLVVQICSQHWQRFFHMSYTMFCTTNRGVLLRRCPPNLKSVRPWGSPNQVTNCSFCIRSNHNRRVLRCQPKMIEPCFHFCLGLFSFPNNHNTYGFRKHFNQHQKFHSSLTLNMWHLSSLGQEGKVCLDLSLTCTTSSSPMLKRWSPSRTFQTLRMKRHVALTSMFLKFLLMRGWQSKHLITSTTTWRSRESDLTILTRLLWKHSNPRTVGIVCYVHAMHPILSVKQVKPLRTLNKFPTTICKCWNAQDVVSYVPNQNSETCFLPNIWPTRTISHEHADSNLTGTFHANIRTICCLETILTALVDHGIEGRHVRLRQDRGRSTRIQKPPRAIRLVCNLGQEGIQNTQKWLYLLANRNFRMVINRKHILDKSNLAGLFTTQTARIHCIRTRSLQSTLKRGSQTNHVKPIWALGQTLIHKNHVFVHRSAVLKKRKPFGHRSANTSNTAVTVVTKLKTRPCQLEIFGHQRTKDQTPNYSLSLGLLLSRLIPCLILAILRRRPFTSVPRSIPPGCIIVVPPLILCRSSILSPIGPIPWWILRHLIEFAFLAFPFTWFAFSFVPIVRFDHTLLTFSFTVFVLTAVHPNMSKWTALETFCFRQVNSALRRAVFPWATLATLGNTVTTNCMQHVISLRHVMVMVLSFFSRLSNTRNFLIPVSVHGTKFPKKSLLLLPTSSCMSIRIIRLTSTVMKAVLFHTFWKTLQEYQQQISLTNAQPIGVNVWGQRP